MIGEEKWRRNKTESAWRGRGRTHTGKIKTQRDETTNCEVGRRYVRELLGWAVQDYVVDKWNLRCEAVCDSSSTTIA